MSAMEYGSLTLVQQAKLMTEIDKLCEASNGDDKVDELRYFIRSLEEHGFITPPVRVRYFQGIEFALDRRRKKHDDN